MAKKKEEEMIRVHNQGKRTIDYYPDPDEKKKKPKYILPNRAVEMKESIANKYLKSYPHDLIEFDSLVSGEKKNISKENARLESVNETLTVENDQLKQDNQELKDKVQELDSDANPDVQALKDEIQFLKDKIAESEKGPEETTETTKDGQDEKPDTQEKAGQAKKE